MKKSQSIGNSCTTNRKAKNGTNGFLPNSLKFISSCVKTVSSNVRSAGASVASSISAAASDSDDHRKDQVLWACFDKLELSPSFRRVLLVGYSNGFQVLDVEDASNVCELVSRRDDPVTFLQMQPIPAMSNGPEGFRNSHPMLLVVACDEAIDSIPAERWRDGFIEPQTGNILNPPSTVRFYSLRSHNYVHSLRFRSTVYMIRSSPQILAVGLVAQIYCFDAVTLETKFSVLTYPVPQLGGQGFTGVNIGYGPMAVGPRWLAYASNNPILSNTGRLSPQSLSPSPGVSPSTSPGNGNMVARYAMESSKQLAAGLINLGDMGYKTLSKYCHEILPDGSSSPVSSSTSWKGGRGGAIHLTDIDATGVVMIKDFVSQAVISQFRAHTSPISALCFDPSGTLLVTASTCGNNINVFRIIPCSQIGSGTHGNNWSCSYVHLYKLHRGVTPAVIQDICFSSYSQWVAIISSRGTCHIFVLSPFGGETGLQLQNSPVDGPSLVPILSLPWWFTSSFLTTHQSSTPPAAITLSVISRIKNLSAWMNTVSNATSTAGKAPVPSGIVAAVFHNCISHDVHPASLSCNALEHLLAFTRSGHLIQYALRTSLGGDQGDSSFRTWTGSSMQMHEDEVGVKVEPVQWWDVCRRAYWPEREEHFQGIKLSTRAAVDAVMGTSASEDADMEGKEFVKLHAHSHWYLSNAEVQLRSGRVPLWQKSKIYFYTMSLKGFEEQNLSQSYGCEEIEIERFPVNEVETRRNDLLPVFNHFHRICTNWNDERSSFDDRTSATQYASSIGMGKSEYAAFNANVVSACSVQKSHTGSQQTSDVDKVDIKSMSYLQNDLLDEDDGVGVSGSILTPMMQNQISSTPKLSTNIMSSLEERNAVNSPTFPNGGSVSIGGMCARDAQSSSSAVTSEGSNSSSNRSDTSMNIIDEGPAPEDMCDRIDFGQYFQEGYFKAATDNKSLKLAEVITDIDSNNCACEKEKSEDDKESDLLGGVFDCSEGGV
ncbi:autophagy-related protein 18h-like isoform X1 [Ipomoea triloba]|uniref:autophagy-related protein 18h-like isoform X1 n=1 Tax=Ipomoea triloba TaxID=35885 RepID=UPI00125CD58A|nr:autophagy-related protein 18h-like isoform X1 [Ipomoea triloba]